MACYLHYKVMSPCSGRATKIGVVSAQGMYVTKEIDRVIEAIDGTLEKNK